MLVSEGLGDPDDEVRGGARGVGQELAKVIVIGEVELVLDNHGATASILEEQGRADTDRPGARGREV